MNNLDGYISTCINKVFDKEGRAYLMGIAILWIFIFHIYCWFKGTLPWWLYFFSEGQTGVDIFLFLSAYGLEASLRKNGWKQFYINRAKRILPVYIFFLSAIFIIFTNDIPLWKIFQQCAAQLTGFSLFQSNDFFSTKFEFDWFTPALIIFYVSFPLISYGMNLLSNKNINYEIITLIILVMISLWALRSIQLPIKAFIYRLPIFMLGVDTYIHLNNKQINRILILYMVALIGGYFSNQHWFLTSTSVPVILVVYSIIQGNCPFYKTISLLGRHSFEIYLAHIFPVTNFFMLIIFDNIYIFIIVTVVWTIAVATIFSYFHKYFNILLKTITK